MADSSPVLTTYSPVAPQGSPPPSLPLIWSSREKFPLSKAGALLSSPSRSEALHNDDGHGQPLVWGLLGLQPWPPPQPEDELLKKGGVMAWDVRVVRCSMYFDYRTSDFRNYFIWGSLRTRTNWSSMEHYKKFSAWGFLGLQPWPSPSSSRTSRSSKGEEMSCPRTSSPGGRHTDDGLLIILLVIVRISVILLVRKSIFRVGSIQLEIGSFLEDQVRPSI